MTDADRKRLSEAVIRLATGINYAEAFLSEDVALGYDAPEADYYTDICLSDAKIILSALKVVYEHERATIETSQ